MTTYHILTVQMQLLFLHQSSVLSFPLDISPCVHAEMPSSISLSVWNDAERKREAAQATDCKDEELVTQIQGDPKERTAQGDTRHLSNTLDTRVNHRRGRSQTGHLTAIIPSAYGCGSPVFQDPETTVPNIQSSFLPFHSVLLHLLLLLYVTNVLSLF